MSWAFVWNNQVAGVFGSPQLLGNERFLLGINTLKLTILVKTLKLNNYGY